MRKSKIQGFSLVEVVLALAVVSFAFVAILGLIPAGMNSFRQAINVSVCTQIGQKVIGDAFQADYDTLLTPLGLTQDSTTPFLTNYRYFDEEGNEIIPYTAPVTNNSNIAPRNQAGALVPFTYLVITKVSPYVYMPGLPTSPSSTGVPSGASAQTATITVQVVFDPSQYLPPPGGADFFTSNNGPTPQSYDLLNSSNPPNIPAGNVLTYYAHITRN